MQKRLLRVLPCVATVAVAVFLSSCSQSKEDQYVRAMTTGAGYLQRGEATNAVNAYSQAVALAPESVDAHLNLATAYLLAGNLDAVVAQCQQGLALDHNNPGAYYLLGCAYLRKNQAEPAVQAFQESQKIDPEVTALNLQLGLAQERLGHWDEAIHEFETVVQYDPENPSAHYQLSRLYQRAGRADDAARELARHQQILAKNPNPPSGPLAYERCKYTEPRIAFVLDQPDRRGVPVRFVDATASVFGSEAAAYRGPVGVLDYNHDGRNSLFVAQGDGFRLLDNVKGRFTPLGPLVPGTTGAAYRRCLVGDLNNDRFDDVVVLGEQALHVFRFATNGQFREFTTPAGLKGAQARDGWLADLDFTGKLDLLTVLPGGQGLRLYRNLGSFYFQEQTTNSGLPTLSDGLEQLAVDDWRNEDVPDVFVTRTGRAPLFFAKQRAGALVETNLAPAWPAGTALALGDLNNDLLLDFVLADELEVRVGFGGPNNERLSLPLRGLRPKGLLLLDYDNDGWLDILAYGNSLRVWRNQGKAGFDDVTAGLGLDKVGEIEFVAAADLDGDGDTDLIFGTAGGLQFWRNDGGNANKQLKLQLVGNRSNASGLGVRVELASGHWRAIRTQTRIPFEIGTGKHDKIELLKARWFDLATTAVDVPIQPQSLALVELMLPTGSCPYLYAWNGTEFGFVTDILGASPMGLPANKHHYIDADPEELLVLGNNQRFPARDGCYEVRITSELREVLYLDQASLVVVDHPVGTLVHSTSKMHAAKPFPPHELWTLRTRAPLRQATRSDGLDVTVNLATADGQMVSPVRRREPQLRGLAEPFAVTMDFGPLPTDERLVLALCGWLRFGGGMANIGASLDPNLPFPFPILEAELADGSWTRVPIEVGTPVGKSKTILVDLENKLPAGARQLRLTTAFEIHWDSAVLCTKADASQNTVTTLGPDHADLHWHGFGEYAALPDWLPLTPQYDQTRATPPWQRTPAGWCTRYGPVEELVAEKDNALVVLNGGDELALSFQAARLPPERAGFERDFFLYVVGWEKDADFHVGEGWRVEPLPFLGMDDQAYGHQARPHQLDDRWIRKYNTRWVGPLVLRRCSP